MNREAVVSNGQPAQSHTQNFWAKSEPRHGYPKRVHLLEHHLADVGACFEALMEQSTIQRRLAGCGGLGGIDQLDETTIARLSVLAALHDIGKVNVGFQTQIWRDEDHSTFSRPRKAGHVADLVPVLQRLDHETAEWFFDALGWWWDAVEGWDDREGETVGALFLAALSHHGSPLQLEGGKQANPEIWRGYGGLDPKGHVRRIGALVHQWFPKAFDARDARPLPSEPAFQHMFLGLCILADWIGSNQRWFEFCDQPRDDYMNAVARPQAKRAIMEVGLNIKGQRAKLAGRHSVESSQFKSLFPGIREPNAIQLAAADAPVGEPLAIIESETGSGKTEAALWRFALMYSEGLVDGLYFALPTRSSAVQLHGRVQRFAEAMFPEEARPPVVLAVPGYEVDPDAEAAALGYDSHAAGHPEEEKPWASERPKHYLAAQIAVGTVDQAMMAALKVKHAHLRAACLARNLLVVDEVHASDTYMTRILKGLLDAHLGAGGYALLMSATLGSVARTQWLSDSRRPADEAPSLDEAVAAPYPSISLRSRGNAPLGVGENERCKTLAISAQPLMRDHQAVAGRAFRAARDGARVLVVRNTVGYAIDTQQALEELASAEGDRRLLFSCGDVLTLHHGRFASVDRRMLDREIEEQLGRHRESSGLVVVGTQTLEQSLDIDADLLITDLCPMDVLLQRIGRLHRHTGTGRPSAHRDARCIVLTPEGGDLSLFLKAGDDRNGLGPHGHVYEDLRILEATRRLLTEQPTWEIPRMNRELVERATHPGALQQIESDMGDDWMEHGRKVMGGEIADGLTAARALLRRNKSFFTDNQDVLFPSQMEANIRTRLGEDRLDVEFDPLPVSPFAGNSPIAKVAISVRWLRGATIEGPVVPTLADSGFTFNVGDRAFRYDRLGLRTA